MDLSTGDPVLSQEDTQVHVGINLQAGTLTLTQDGKEFQAYHALVMFASARADPWRAQDVKFSTKAPDGKSVALTVDLLNEVASKQRCK